MVVGRPSVVGRRGGRTAAGTAAGADRRTRNREPGAARPEPEPRPEVVVTGAPVAGAVVARAVRVAARLVATTPRRSRRWRDRRSPRVLGLRPTGRRRGRPTGARVRTTDVRRRGVDRGSPRRRVLLGRLGQRRCRARTSPPEIVLNSRTQSVSRPTPIDAGTGQPAAHVRGRRAPGRPAAARARGRRRCGAAVPRPSAGGRSGETARDRRRRDRWSWPAARPDAARRPGRRSTAPSPRLVRRHGRSDGPSAGAAAPGATATTANLLRLGTQPWRQCCHPCRRRRRCPKVLRPAGRLPYRRY